MPAFGDGVSVSKSYYNLDGTPANLGALKQNDQVVVVIEGELKDRSFRQMALTDLIPAGFGSKAREGRRGRQHGLSVARQAELCERSGSARRPLCRRLHGRHLVPDDRGRSPRPAADLPLRLHRRATIPGSFAQPAAVVEDMYAPSVTARSSMGAVTIAARIGGQGRIMSAEPPAPSSLPSPTQGEGTKARSGRGFRRLKRFAAGLAVGVLA